MPRLARRSAGSRVAARAQRLSDELLVVEEQTFTAMQRTLASGIPDARRAIEAAWIRAKDDPAKVAADARLLRELTSAHTATLRKTVAAAHDLMETTAEMSLASMRDELGLCEATLSARYTGIADVSCDAVEERVEQLVADALAEHTKVLADTVDEFRAAAKKQILMAKQYKDDPVRLTKRLLSETPVHAQGIGGRGVWYRSSSWLNESARAASVGLMNTVRMAAMRSMNEAASA